MLDRWVKWRWEIKWSEYEDENGITKKPSSASLDVFRDNVPLISDKKFRMGRNDEGRVPHFKVGLYNADGIAEKGRIEIKGYKESIHKT